MVWIEDTGSTFDAPIDFVWEYIFGGAGHDAAHTTTRNPKFAKVSDVTILYTSERWLRGTWAADQLRISMFPPVSVVTEWTKGVLAGSKFVYLYTAQGRRTGIDVYGEFTSKQLSRKQVTAAAREFLDSEFAADAPAIRASYRAARKARR